MKHQSSDEEPSTSFPSIKTDHPLFVDASKSGLSRFDKILLNTFYGVRDRSRDSLDSGVLKDIKHEETSQQTSPTLILPTPITTSRDSLDSGVSKNSRIKQSLDSILDESNTETTHVQHGHRIIIESTGDDDREDEALGHHNGNGFSNSVDAASMEKISLCSSSLLSHPHHHLLENSSQEHSLDHMSSFQSDHPNLTRQETISEEYLDFSDENSNAFDYGYTLRRPVRRASKNKEKRHSMFLSIDHGDEKPELSRKYSYNEDRTDEKKEYDETVAYEPRSEGYKRKFENVRAATNNPQHKSHTLGRKLNKQISTVSPGIEASPTVDNAKRPTLVRRHSEFQAKKDECYEMDQILMEYDEGMEMAFERCKAWSKYCTQLLSYIQNRLSYEHQHARSIQKLAEQTRSSLSSDFKNNNYVPLMSTFDEFMGCGDWFVDAVDSTIKTINDRVVKALQQKQQDLDLVRKNLKNEYNKQLRQLQKCEKELNQARSDMKSSESGYLKARESTVRSEMSVPTVVGAEQYRKKKEVEKRRKNEEEALHRKTDAEKLVQRLEFRLETLRQNLDATKQKNIQKLCEWIYRCDQTTKACASHYFQAFATLWSPIPGKYQDLADATRNYRPGTEYMSFLQNLPGRSVSSTSLLRGDKCTDDDAQTATSYSASASVTGIHGPADSMSSSSTSTAQRRRNALTAADYETIAETTARRQKKSVGHLFGPSISEATYSEAAKSHKLQRTRQPLRCHHCDHLSLWGEALKCGSCGAGWHKKCLSYVNVACVPSARTVSNRRMSIFGVSLKDHLQNRKVPLILERCIDELQQRGMNIKGIYRTCGVKSKIEQICIMFEQAEKGSDVDLSDVHPMNIASVIKLYLRKLPEPLMTYELYQDWLDFEPDCDPGIAVKRLRELANRLPPQNFETLRHLSTHLKRVTWFEAENFMTASNLAAVIAPSLIWSPTAHTGPSTPASIASGYTTSSTFINDAHQQTKVVELLIKHAFEVFCVDKMEDWREFFQKYPDLAEPNILDEKSEAQIAQQINSDLPETADFDDEDDDELEEDQEPGHSSSNTSQQPPTPDLLRNTTNARNEDGNPEDIESKNAIANYRNTPILSNRSTYSSSHQDSPILSDKTRIGKQRSYTTSILVSPQSDRKVILPHKQHSVDGESKFKVQPSQYPQTLCSGEVTIDIKQGQFFIPNDTIARHGSRDRLQLSSSSLRETRNNNDHAKYSSNSTVASPISNNSTNDYSTSSNRFAKDSYDGSRLDERMCLQGVGLIFSGTDVSYV